MLGWATAALAAAALVAVVVLYERELKGMARFLRRGERSANERIDVEFATPGVRAAAAAMNAELDALRDARVAQEDRQRAFQRDLASLSHDIRTPLAGAQGYLQLYERTDDAHEQARCLTEAASRLAAMRELTDKLFEYAKAVDADSPLAAERVEVVPVLADVLAGAYPQFVERGWGPKLDFSCEDAAVLADGEALERVFANLLTNALRYGVAPPRITLRADEDVVTVGFANRVADHAAVKPDQLFERFYRADGARSGDGSGLGLAIVAGLCERMGGAASARMDDDELVIEVALPRA